jgi:hypothetical protein
MPADLKTNIETVTVKTTQEITNFEIHSAKHSAGATHKIMDCYVTSLNGGKAKKVHNASKI